MQGGVREAELPRSASALLRGRLAGLCASHHRSELPTATSHFLLFALPRCKNPLDLSVAALTNCQLFFSAGLVGSGQQSRKEEEQRPWLLAAGGSTKTAAAAEQLFGHACSLLAAFSVAMEEPPAAKNVLHALPSPMKRQKEVADKSG
jgi:hypothetical protein